MSKDSTSSTLTCQRAARSSATKPTTIMNLKMCCLKQTYTFCRCGNRTPNVHFHLGHVTYKRTFARLLRQPVVYSNAFCLSPFIRSLLKALNSNLCSLFLLSAFPDFLLQGSNLSYL